MQTCYRMIQPARTSSHLNGHAYPGTGKLVPRQGSIGRKHLATDVVPEALLEEARLSPRTEAEEEFIGGFRLNRTAHVQI